MGRVSPKLPPNSKRIFGVSSGGSSSRPAPRKAVSRLPELPPSARVGRPRTAYVQRPSNGGAPVGPALEVSVETSEIGSERETEHETSENEDAIPPKPRVFRGHMPTLARSRRTGLTHMSESHVNEVPPPVEDETRHMKSIAESNRREDRPKPPPPPRIIRRAGSRFIPVVRPAVAPAHVSKNERN